MNRILTDLALEAQPNFEFPAYAAWLNAIITGGLTREEALAQMAEGWKLERQERITLWIQQSEEDLRLQREQEEQERTAKEAEAAEELREAEKKKPKINDFDVEAVVADVLIPRPSQYALQKIKSMEYVELWYFSPEGCWEASESSRTDGRRFIRLGKGRRKALQDHDLSWRQFDMAKTSFLVHIDKNGWPDKHQQALALFFTLITNHEHRVQSLQCKKTLLRYAGFVRREWH
ncbi:uncharacterized protein F5891DRAFT_980130 [Suillus fuscotomentosus]|uniref:Uncharacterized protein n=1 Tax=Suillus fuscotomentosus TaxID=1912939 RepID=A0AAD4E6A8_9AGAM|nr:uncharacterized protein F5891DRAFT_980130 [Suillus fuscotomentosus]KAG1900535.1 hypothetical protein F5891DRAFT_980130 [Suillus fuscotomentosus]